MNAFAQPANDDPCNAFLLTATNTCTYQYYTTLNATPSVGMPVPGCANFVGGDVWFKVVVPCTGSLTFDTQIGNTAPSISDGGMAAYTGPDCNTLTLLSCNDDGSPNGAMPLITSTGLTAGDTVWVRFWEYGNDNQGSFGLCTAIPPPGGPGSNCSTASPFCTGTVYNFPNNTGIPSLGSAGIYGCLFSTPNPVFYYFQMQTSGSLDIHIVQTSTSGAALDVDFACWGPFPDLASSCTGISATNIVDCSYSTSNDEYCNIPAANAGEYYVLLLTNYSNQPGSINFQQSGGTANTNCNVICNITASNTGPICPGQSFTLNSTLGGAAYTWIGPDCFTSTLQNPTVATAPSTPGSYLYTIYASTPSGENCSTTTTVVVGGLPNGTETHTNTTCPGLTDGSITVTPSSPDTYVYTLNPGNIVQNSPVFSNLGPGSYNATFTNPIGCSGSVNNIIIANGNGPTATAAVVNTTCPGVNDATITITPPTTGGPFTFTLNPGNIVQTSPIFTNLSPGFYNLTFTTSNTCNGSLNNILVLQGNPVSATAVTAPTSCPTVNDGTLTITPPASGGPFTYTLTPGNIIQNGNPIFTGLASGVYHIDFTTIAGCTGAVTPDPFVGQGLPLTSTVTTSNPPCSNINDGIITINPPVPGNYTYVLNPSTPTAITQINNPSFTGLAAGNYTYSFTDAAGCVGVGATSLTTNTPITTTVSLTMPLCNGGSDGIISLVPAGGVPSYEFSIDGGTTWQTSGVFNTVAAGVHTITIKDNAGCTKDTTVTMNEPTLLLASATSTPGTCNGNDGQILVTGTDGTPGYTYSIDNGTTYVPTATFVVTGGDFPDIKVMDANGCVASTSVNVQLIDNMVITPVPDTTICIESSVMLIPNVSTEATIFDWRTIPDPAAVSTLNNANIKTPTATPSDTTIYIVHAIWGVCDREDTIVVNILKRPVPDAGQNMTVCNYKRDTILVGSTLDSSGPVSYHWEPANTILPPYSADAAITVAVPDSTQTYTLSVSDNYGCNFVMTANVTVFVQAPVPAFAGHDTLAFTYSPSFRDTFQLRATGGVSYAWSPMSNLIPNGTNTLGFYANDPSHSSPYAMLYGDQMYIVVVTDAEGCLGSDSIYIRVFDRIEDGEIHYKAPNAFTPNGDGLNDYFRLIPVGFVNTEWVKIYNRNGQLLFSSNKWMQGWDGTFQGKKQPTGTYVWVAKGKNKQGEIVTDKGTFILIN